jgi:hypothetical protein
MNLYLRLICVLWKIWRLPRKGVFDESRVTFRVLPTDCDVNFHLNNGRYLAFMDLGRLHLTAQIGTAPGGRGEAVAADAGRRGDCVHPPARAVPEVSTS